MTGDEKAELAEQCATRYANRLHAADAVQLAHELQRCGCFPKSPFGDRLRQLVDHERTSRLEAA